MMLVGFFSALWPSTSVAQVQKGQVRTIERPGKKSQGLEGVVISIFEAPNDVISSNSGTFSFSLPGKKAGDSYTVRNVRKTNYSLLDKEVRGRKYGYSPTVLLEIVMVSDQQKMEDTKRIEAAAEERAERRYNQQKKELDRLKEKKRIVDKDYAKKDEALREDYATFLKFASKLAETYALTDYKNISELNRQICQAIENAELEKADSLIRSKGNIDKREEEAIHQIHMGDSIATIGNSIKDKGKELLNDLAQDYYHRFTIFVSDFENDSAACQLERRAALDDSTNVEWANDAGVFLRDYLADYDRAFAWFGVALRQARRQYGEQSEWTATAYDNIGLSYAGQGKYDEALKQLAKALAIREKMPESDSINLALSYNNMGTVYDQQGKYDKALEYYNKSLDFRLATMGENHASLANVYNNIGETYCNQENYGKALEHFGKALAIKSKALGTEHHSTAITYNNMALAYTGQGDLPKALEYFGHALRIFVKVYGPDHPNVGTCYNNIGQVYEKQGNYDKAIEYYQKDVEIESRIYGTDNANLASTYNNLGFSYYKKGNFAEAVHYYHKSLSILSEAFGDEHPYSAICHKNIGNAYLGLHDCQKALEHYQKALPVLKKQFGPKHRYTIETKKNMKKARKGR